MSQINPIYRLPKVKEIVGVSKASIYAWIANEEFPRPVVLGPKSVGWRESDIKDWVDKRPSTKR